MENDRADRLFADPGRLPWLANRVRVAGTTSGRQRYSDCVTHPFFDDFLKRLASKEAIQQIVLLAAGLDTRAFRLTWPVGTQIFELDQPAVLQYKEQVLRSLDALPACGGKRSMSILPAPGRQHSSRPDLTWVAHLVGCWRVSFSISPPSKLPYPG